MLDTLENAIEHNEFILSIFKAIAGEEKVKLTRVTLFAIRAINEALKEGHSIDEIPLPVEVVEAIQNFAKMVMLRAKKKRITAGLPLWIDKLTILVDDND
jgi:hypothetical protein